MKIFLTLFIMILLVPGILNAQKKGKTKEIGKELLGTYEGNQPKYAMKNKNGGDMVIGGNKVWVPGCEYKFELKAKNKVTMSQLSEEETKPYIYSGTYTVIKDETDRVEILCKVSLNNKSNPEYTLVIDKKTKTATAYGKSEPSFTLNKIK